MCCVHLIIYFVQILARWERIEKSSVSSKGLKRAQLEALVKMCGLSPAGISVVNLRRYLESLRRHKLPNCDMMVIKILTEKYQEDLGGGYV